MWKARCAAAGKQRFSSTQNSLNRVTNRSCLPCPALPIRTYASGTSSSTSSSTPVVKYTLAFLLVAGAGYTGAAYYALHDPAFRKVWVDNVLGGEAALQTVASGAETVKGTSVEEVKKTAENVRGTVTEKYEKTVETISELKDGATKGYQTAVEKVHETQDAAQKKIENVTAFVNSIKNDAVATYEIAHGKVKQAEASVRGFAASVEQTYYDTVNSVEDTYDNVRSMITGEPPKPKPPRPVVVDTKPLSPPPSAIATPSSPAKSAVRLKSPETVPSDPEVKLPPKPKSEQKPVALVIDVVVKEEPRQVVVEPVVRTAVVIEDDAPAKAGVVVITGEGPAIVPATEKPATSEPVGKSVAGDALEVSFKNIESAFQTAPDRPIARSLAHSITSLAVTLGALIGSTSEEGRVKLEKARSELVALTNYLNALETEEANLIQTALQEQAAKFGKTLKNHVEAAQKALGDQSREYEDRFSKVLKEDRERLISEHNAELAEKLSKQAKEFQAALDENLRKQAEELEKHWAKEVKSRVDEERGGRLARLDHLALKLKYLERISIDAGESLDRSHKLHRLWSALKAVNDVLEQPYQASLAKEVAVLKQLGDGFPVVETVVQAIPAEVIREGVPTVFDLEHSFERVRDSVRKAQFIPPHGGPVSYAISYALSYVTFKKKGLVPGDDVESVLARTEFFLREGDVDTAARELNQLKGWPRVLAKDWLTSARRYLELKQALEVVETHLSLMSLGAV
ncbi:hypothetical protein SpCBS45565_g03691 [Spizellomyces sp. 'palustris']|nr:hypothetical protein SpCBS45565_g03691 [Spizellomyces sp. 'palustris']